MNTLPDAIFLTETASTNLYLKQLSDSKRQPDETAVVSDYQSAGRGQIGNSWSSEAGNNLTFSILYYPQNLAANKSFLIAEMTALSVKRALDKFVGDIRVKWSNDIYWQDRKICGILIENDISDGLIARSIIGIGLNINQTEFSPELPNPVSLQQITGLTYDRIQILDEIRAAFHSIRQQAETGGADDVKREYRRSLYRSEGFFTFKDTNGSFEAHIHHIEPDGHLVLERADGTFSRYAFKEVEFL